MVLVETHFEHVHWFVAQRVLPHEIILLLDLNNLLKGHYIIWQHLENRLTRTILLKIFLLLPTSALVQSVLLCLTRFLTCQAQTSLKNHLYKLLSTRFLVLKKLELLFLSTYLNDLVRKQICILHHPLKVILHFQELSFGFFLHH